ncbi:hypothetical protein CYLTODRAFT_409114 [Cylindrobasidium torrendii FP15055 ss-10]|uniref:DRBM domain-containing protein n=1 Tax=Cylindrobasidium torrendii FP15055 ss-10 TaxID=1314674 RepID=A0A0D7BIB1_9AGAR|nr:hypothetical protein CYLTODRAFT_409114 [Cylindrobasidium torrendii FP15055 ss-10]
MDTNQKKRARSPVPLPQINVDHTLQVFTHKSLRDPDDPNNDNERLGQLGEVIFELAVLDALMGEKPHSSVDKLETRLRDIVDGDQVPEWIDQYRMLNKVRCVPDVRKALSKPAEARVVFMAYVAAVFMEKGIAAVKEWMESLLGLESTSTRKLKSIPSVPLQARQQQQHAQQQLHSAKGHSLSPSPSPMQGVMSTSPHMFRPGVPGTSSTNWSQAPSLPPARPLPQPMSMPGTSGARPSPAQWSQAPSLPKPMPMAGGSGARPAPFQWPQASSSTPPRPSSNVTPYLTVQQPATPAPQTQPVGPATAGTSEKQSMDTTPDPHTLPPPPYIARPTAPNPITPAQPGLAFLPLFNQTAAQRKVKVEYNATFSGPAHAGKWYVTCIVNGLSKGSGSGGNKQIAKEEAARSAYYAMGWS